MAGPYALGSFDDQFSLVTGQNTTFQYSFEVPFDCVLRRASIFAKASSALDGYVTILKNGVEIVSAGSAPPNRNLPAVAALKAYALSNIDAVKGDKLTVRLNLVSLNTVERCKILIAYAVLVARDVVPLGYYGY